ncbi:Gfo/Idh/MocA family protein [Paenibacillus sp. MBLB4367]|uniref:Gfo/Idh/MocA family protein n=1 Tax=Paenibacillus sp. MBLB4367 TaxID=3384767 RepID=UPI0039083791
MSKLKFSIIGCQHGHVDIFISEMLALGHECVGIYEPDNIQLATSIAGKHGIPLVADRSRLVADDVDVVGSAAVNSEKIDVIELCEAHGKPIMVDKPIVTSTEAFERLQAVIGRGKIKVGMLLTERFSAAIHTLKKLIDNGELGDIVTIGMRKPHRLRKETRPDWFFDKAQCGGIVIDLFIHDFDLLRWFTGKEVVATEGYVSKNILPEHPTFYDAASLLVRLEGDIVAQLYADWHTPEKSWTWGDGRIFVTGTQGFAELRLEGDPSIGHRQLLLQVTNESEQRQIEPEQPPFTITEDFLKHIAGKPHVITHDAILKSTWDTLQADAKTPVIGRYA